jgi:hypothetical protein
MQRHRKHGQGGSLPDGRICPVSRNQGMNNPAGDEGWNSFSHSRWCFFLTKLITIQLNSGILKKKTIHVTAIETKITCSIICTQMLSPARNYAKITGQKKACRKRYVCIVLIKARLPGNATRKWADLWRLCLALWTFRACHQITWTRLRSDLGYIWLRRLNKTRRRSSAALRILWLSHGQR